MKIEKLIEEGHQAKLIVEVEPENMQTYKQRAARKISERGKIPGFRPGKAPYDVVRRYFGDTTITQEAIEVLVDEVYPAALKEADIKPAAMGQLENIESVKPPVFKFTVPLLPTVDLGAYQTVRKAYEFVAPEDGKFEESLDELRRMYATTETGERPVVDGDFVMLDIKSDFSIEGAPEVELSRDGFPVFVRGNDAEDGEWPFPGFSSKLIQVYRGSNEFDYGISRLASDPAGVVGLVEKGSTLVPAVAPDRAATTFNTIVVVRRLGEAVFPVDVEVRFEDGSRVRE